MAQVGFFDPNTGKTSGSSMTDDEYRLAEILSRYGAPEKEIDLTLAQAKRMRERGLPQGRTAGGMYIAPHWTEGLAYVANQYGGKKTEEQGLLKMQKMRDLLSSDLGRERERRSAVETARQAAIQAPKTQVARNLWAGLEGAGEDDLFNQRPANPYGGY